MGNLQLSMQRLGRDDTGTRPAPPPAPALSVLRVLIRQEGGSDVVYPLGRRTSIGRTPDNDIQVDASWISRHHAVLLSSADNCIVEDLNSTNGVLVNGRRVGRQILHDGDTVKVGKTEFRYQQRS
jgi:pSer/pThr/pTyr-binding forkhead associated (FHA) protein